jgi:hypothetical protein
MVKIYKESSMRKLVALPIMVFFVLIGLAAYAADPLDLKMAGFLVTTAVDQDGNKMEKLEALPEKVQPGDIIEYVLSSLNKEDASLHHVTLSAKMPEGTVYTGSQKCPEGTSVVYSIDKGKTFSAGPIKYVVIEDGKEIEKTATPDMYTNMQWLIKEIKSKDVAKCHYRVTVK